MHEVLFLRLGIASHRISITVQLACSVMKKVRKPSCMPPTGSNHRPNRQKQLNQEIISNKSSTACRASCPSGKAKGDGGVEGEGGVSVFGTTAAYQVDELPVICDSVHASTLRTTIRDMG